MSQLAFFISSKKIIGNIKYSLEIHEINKIMEIYIHTIKKAHIIIVIFDLKNRDSFDDVTLWMNYLRDVCQINRHFYLLGNYKSEKNILTTINQTL